MVCLSQLLNSILVTKLFLTKNLLKAERAIADQKNLNWENLVDSEASETSEIWRRERRSLASATSEIWNFCTFEKPWRERELGISWDTMKGWLQSKGCLLTLSRNLQVNHEHEFGTLVQLLWGCKKLLCLHRMLWGCAQYLKTHHHAYPASIQVHTPYDPAIANFSIQTNWWNKTDQTIKSCSTVIFFLSPKVHISRNPCKGGKKMVISGNSGHCLSVQLHWC